MSNSQPIKGTSTFKTEQVLKFDKDKLSEFIESFARKAHIEGVVKGRILEAADEKKRKKQAQDNAKKEVKKRIKLALQKTGEITESLIEHLQTLDILCDYILIQPRGFVSELQFLGLCVILKEKHFTNRDVDQIYKWIFDQNLRTDELSLEISLMPNSKHLNWKKLENDNYLLFYERQSK